MRIETKNPYKKQLKNRENPYQRPKKPEKPSTNSGTTKENVSSFSVTDKGIGVVGGAFHQIEVRSYHLEQTSIKDHRLSQIDSSSVFRNSRLDSQWLETCGSSGLDELDSEILESSGLAELDAEILGTNSNAEVDAEIPRNSGETELNSGIVGSGNASICEADYRKSSCGSYRLI
ncbi:hypothetical protein RND81_05G127000 [Saponaria officinalis]|uniref:Uncharacterized protein n=1 Tax=Saponaria officinalis TaxID=3572 RepID=A0AAW1KWU9_SAPOF